MKPLLTTYAEKLDTRSPLSDYPRPQMVRNSYFCLNGAWDYSMNKSETVPQNWEGKILVPFAPESNLSGVKRVLQPDEFLWYHKRFSLPPEFEPGRILLHFGAVDECCVVQLNGKEAGRHDGGYLPFCLDVTDLIRKKDNHLIVMVIDETDEAPYTRGRQKMEHEGRWHSPMSGIWQTVWMECVPESYIRDVRVTPRYDESQVEIEVLWSGEPADVKVEAFARSTRAGTAVGTTGTPIVMDLPGALSWTPKRPFLYTVRITAGEDQVASYFGMRKFSVSQQKGGYKALMLNNRPFFGCGVVDQGMYSDGLYTPPSDDAMSDDIQFAKECGFNIIRKIGKVEPARWYYHCDRLGMLVWQDMPGGGDENGKLLNFAVRHGFKDRVLRRTGVDAAEGREVYRRDLDRMLEFLHSHPCVQTWVLFNEGQGQFCAGELAREVKKKDPTRLVDHASGWYDQGDGDLMSLHFYETPPVFTKSQSEDPRARVISSVGDFGLYLPRHFGGKEPEASHILEDGSRLEKRFIDLYRRKLPAVLKQGLAAVFYYQLSDTEDEVSGLLTADRRRHKVDPLFIEALNRYLRKEDI